MGFIEDEHGSYAVGLSAQLEVLLEPAHKHGVGAGGRHAHGGGDFAAEVALVEVGDFDVVYTVAGLRQALAQGAQ